MSKAPCVCHAGKRIVFGPLPDKPLALPADVVRHQVQQHQDPRRAAQCFVVRASGAVEKWLLDEQEERIVLADQLRITEREQPTAEALRHS